jgi:chromosome segregation ATPase
MNDEVTMLKEFLIEGFNKLDEGIVKLSHKVDHMEAKLDEQTDRVTRLEVKMDQVEKDLDSLHKEDRSIRAEADKTKDKLTKVVTWIGAVSMSAMMLWAVAKTFMQVIK